MSNQWPVSIFRRTKKQQHGRFEDAGASVEQWSEPCFQVEWYSMSAYLFVEVLWYRRHQWSRAMLIHHTVTKTKCYKQKQQFIIQYPNNTFDWIIFDGQGTTRLGPSARRPGRCQPRQPLGVTKHCATWPHRWLGTTRPGNLDAYCVRVLPVS